MKKIENPISQLEDGLLTLCITMHKALTDQGISVQEATNYVASYLRRIASTFETKVKPESTTTDD